MLNWQKRRSCWRAHPKICHKVPVFLLYGVKAVAQAQLHPQVRLKIARPDFRTVLGDHNIYIGEQDPTAPLLKQAKKIISEPHQSSEMDDAIVLLLKTNLKRIAAQGEDALVGALSNDLFPAIRVIPDPKIEARRNETWDNAIAIALPPGPASSTILPPLPKPKPDLVFGYSKTAFDLNQRSVIRLLSNISGSYAVPAKGLIFPF